MSTDTYQQELAQQLHHQLHALPQQAALPPRTLDRVAANVEYLMSSDRFAGWLRPLPNGQVLLLVSTYAPDNPSWAFHFHLVSSEGRTGAGHLLARFTEGPAQHKLFIGDFSLSADYRNAGTGSWMLAPLLDFCRVAQVGVVEGEIAGVDWERVDMLEHFYTKHGFAVTANQKPKSKALKKLL